MGWPLIAAIAAVVSSVGSVIMQKKMEKDMEDQQAGFLVSKSGGSNPLKLIYGKRRVATDNVWKGISKYHWAQNVAEADSYYHHSKELDITNGRKHKDYLHRLDVWCQGPVQSIGNFKIDDDKITVSRFDGNAKAVCRFYNKHGNSSQNMFSGLVTGAQDITSDMLGNDVAYSWSRFLYRTSPDFQGEPNVTAEIEGLLVWDPRVNPNDPTIKSWSDNPALCLLDYLTADYGRGLELSDIDLPSFISAANSCDALVTLPAEDTVTLAGDYYNPISGSNMYLSVNAIWPWQRVGQPTGQRKRYTSNLILESSNSTLDNAKELLKCMKGSLPFLQGKYKLVLEEEGTSVFTFNDDNILGSVSLGWADRSKRLNRCTVKFPNENKGYKPDTVSWPAANTALHLAYQSQDNGDDLHTEIELTGITDRYQARDLAEFTVRDSRTQEFIEFKAQPTALLIECGDIITVTNDILNIVAKDYRVRKCVINADLTVTIKAQVYDADVYPWNLTDDDTEAANLQQAPTAFDDPLPVTNFQGTGSTSLNQDGTAVSRIDAEWDAIESDTSSVAVIEVGIKEVGSTDYTWVALPPDSTQYIFAGLPDLTDFEIAIRYRNILGRVSSVRSALVSTVDANTALDSADQVARDAAAAAQSAADNAAALAADAQTAQEVQDAIANDTTLINGSRIVTGTLDGSDITATTQITVGTGNDVAKLSGSDSDYRIWAGHSSAASAPFAVDKDGEVTIKSAASGERLELVGDAIKIYDSTGQLRVTLGNLS